MIYYLISGHCKLAGKKVNIIRVLSSHCLECVTFAFTVSSRQNHTQDKPKKALYQFISIWLYAMFVTLGEVLLFCYNRMPTKSVPDKENK